VVGPASASTGATTGGVSWFSRPRPQGRRCLALHPLASSWDPRRWTRTHRKPKPRVKNAVRGFLGRASAISTHLVREAQPWGGPGTNPGGIPTNGSRALARCRCARVGAAVSGEPFRIVQPEARRLLGEGGTKGFGRWRRHYEKTRDLRPPDIARMGPARRSKTGGRRGGRANRGTGGSGGQRGAPKRGAGPAQKKRNSSASSGGAGGAFRAGPAPEIQSGRRTRGRRQKGSRASSGSVILYEPFSTGGPRIPGPWARRRNLFRLRARLSADLLREEFWARRSPRQDYFELHLRYEGSGTGVGV